VSGACAYKRGCKSGSQPAEVIQLVDADDVSAALADRLWYLPINVRTVYRPDPSAITLELRAHAGIPAPAVSPHRSGLPRQPGMHSSSGILDKHHQRRQQQRQQL
jgi:hypothetical protein